MIRLTINSSIRSVRRLKPVNSGSHKHVLKREECRKNPRSSGQSLLDPLCYMQFLTFSDVTCLNSPFVIQGIPSQLFQWYCNLTQHSWSQVVWAQSSCASDFEILLSFLFTTKTIAIDTGEQTKQLQKTTKSERKREKNDEWVWTWALR